MVARGKPPTFDGRVSLLLAGGRLVGVRGHWPALNRLGLGSARHYRIGVGMRGGGYRTMCMGMMTWA